MRGARQRRLTIAWTSALAIAGFLGAGAEAAPPPGQVSFSTPRLFPNFSPGVFDYVVRCNDAPVRVQGHASGGWEVKIGNHAYETGDFSKVVQTGSGRAFTVVAKRSQPAQLYSYHVRCLPNNFPTYTYTRSGPVSPKFLAADRDFTSKDTRWGMIFDDHGVPIWWIHAQTHATSVLSNGNVLWFDRPSYKWEVHRLDGSLVRTLDAVGPPADLHDLQPLRNGNYLVGSYVNQQNVDTSAYGGSSNATVTNTELQHVSADGQLVWDWNSQDHISLAETGRHWPFAINEPTNPAYDIAHWNSIEPAGDSVIASFRHFDAVYKIRKATGEIVWKLGGTTTPESLEVINDPRGYTFGAQHDARLLPDGTLTVFDNRSNLDNKTPRAVRYRIDEQGGTATLLESITDPEVPASSCCGSARRLRNGDWLIGWGKDYRTGKAGAIGGYKPSGQRTFLLSFDTGFSYRAEPVPPGAVSAQDLRDGMKAMAQAQLP
jgi:Arylsulfotransferase (ASST)